MGISAKKLEEIFTLCGDPSYLYTKSDGSHINIKPTKAKSRSSHKHFEMESIWTANLLMKPDFFVASVDLKMPTSQGEHRQDIRNKYNSPGVYHINFGTAWN